MHPGLLSSRERILGQLPGPLVLTVATDQEHVGVVELCLRDTRYAPDPAIATESRLEMVLSLGKPTHRRGEYSERPRGDATRCGNGTEDDVALSEGFQQLVQLARVGSVAERRARFRQQIDARQPEHVAGEAPEAVHSDRLESARASSSSPSEQQSAARARTTESRQGYEVVGDRRRRRMELSTNRPCTVLVIEDLTGKSSIEPGVLRLLPGL